MKPATEAAQLRERGGSSFFGGFWFFVLFFCFLQGENGTNPSNMTPSLKMSEGASTVLPSQPRGGVGGGLRRRQQHLYVS